MSTVPFEEIYSHRYGVLSANTTLGGLPHNWLELYGGTPVTMSMVEPDAETFRSDWYYNTVRNQLYKRLGHPKRWLLASADVLSDDGIKPDGSTT
ncbi:MAG: hypothetical protein Q8K86_11460 [Candidatus Nanopelagicaceae bacterium]|nr:hypothetical protein [Candidatus Nanopelagicaceae bacterium]